MRYREAILLKTSLFISSIIATAVTFSTVFLCIYWRVQVPYQDMVEVMDFLDKFSNPNFTDFFLNLHDMEHRPAIPGLIWYADRLLFQSYGLMPLILSLLLLSLTTLILVSNWLERSKHQSLFVLACCAVSAAQVFNLSNWYNLSWEKQLHVAMSLFFLSFGAKIIGGYESRLKNNSKVDTRLVFTVSTLCWFASFSFGYGLVLMPVLLIHGFLVRWPLTTQITNVLSFVFMIAFYVYCLSLRDLGFGTTRFSNIQAFETFQYVFGVLGSAFHTIPMSFFGLRESADKAQFFGIFLLIIYLWGAIKFYSDMLIYRRQASSKRSSAVIFTTACISIAVITALSRSQESGGVVDRYIVVSSLFLIALPGIFSDPSKKNNRKFFRHIIPACLLLSGSLLALHHQNNLPKLIEKWHFSRVASIALTYDVYIPGPNVITGPPLHQVAATAKRVWMKQLYRDGERYELVSLISNKHRLFTENVQKSSLECEGKWLKMDQVTGYPEVYFFSVDHKFIVSNSYNKASVVAIDKGGLIVGVGAPFRGGNTPGIYNGNFQINDEKTSDTWSRSAGFIKIKEKREAIRFYYFDSKKVCEIILSKAPKFLNG